MGKKWISVFFCTLIIVIAYSNYSDSWIGLKVPMEKLPMLEVMKKMTVDYYDQPSIMREHQKVEQELALAREAIRKASSMNNTSKFSKSNIYHKPEAFFQSYAEMEKRLKVYVYKEGESPLVHNGPCNTLYTSEGRFIAEMDFGDNKFKTEDPHSAHLYFMPFSVAMMVNLIYNQGTFNLTPIQQFVSDYVNVISTRYPFWNRTSGADHFMISCHDWAPLATMGNSFLYNISIRVLCNANASEGFNHQKDVSLPEVYHIDGDFSPKFKSLPVGNVSKPYLAFFAGSIVGPIRPILRDHWKGRDNDLQVYERLPKDLDYYTLLLKSKFCLCPSGYEVASPRIVEAIYGECVPVILSDYYVLPLSDVLNWEALSITVPVADIPRLKERLLAVPEEKYSRLIDNIRAVKKHFMFNQPAQSFDAFHMILHSVWLRRLNIRLDSMA